MSALAPGKRLEARCTRCRDVTGHVIVAMLDGEVIKVECCACGSVHKYYPPEPKARQVNSRPLRVRSGHERSEAVQERAAASAATSRMEASKGSEPKKIAARQTGRQRVDMESQWREAVARNVSTPVPYVMNTAFVQGTLVDHPVFGVGVVLSLTPPDKMEVLFQEGIKALRCQC